MNRAVNPRDPAVVSAFHHALGQQVLVVFIVAVVLALAWNVVRTIQYRHAVADGRPTVVAPSLRLAPEPPARLVVRLVFGALWVFDGVLQLQPSMPLGLPGQVLSPAASGAAGWVQSVMGLGTSTWTNHPITAAVSAVWIQLGLGIFLLVAPRGRWSRAAGLVSAGWGLVVWVFGEAFGGIFTPGSSWLFGLPGAALLYVVAGGLLALRDEAWRSTTVGRWLLRGLGTFFIGMAVLQAWPGRGTWEGHATSSTGPGTTLSMVQSMSSVPQPGPIVSLLHSFASLDAAHGWAVNLVVVLALATVGVGLWLPSPRALRAVVVTAIALCVAVWVLVQDFGVFGGVGTDVNSMLPTATLLAAGLVAVRHPARAVVPAPADALATASRFDRLTAPYLLRCAGALLAIAVVLLGAAPMAIASTNPTGDLIVTQALNGTVEPSDFSAWGFTLTDQHGRTVSLGALRGHTVVLTFLDPVCTNDCPVLAQLLKRVDLGVGTARTDFVVIDANPQYRSISAIRAFDTVEGVSSLPNWEFLTGSIAALDRLWIDYGVNVVSGQFGSMSGHEDLVFVIDPSGRVRDVVTSDPGNGSASTSSLVAELVGVVNGELSS